MSSSPTWRSSRACAKAPGRFRTVTRTMRSSRRSAVPGWSCWARPRTARTISNLDVTSAIEPLERMSLWDAGEPAETYPYGL